VSEFRRGQRVRVLENHPVRELRGRTGVVVRVSPSGRWLGVVLYGNLDPTILAVRCLTRQLEREETG
jgi:hypothetical protein